MLVFIGFVNHFHHKDTALLLVQTYPWGPWSIRVKGQHMTMKSKNLLAGEMDVSLEQFASNLSLLWGSRQEGFVCLYYSNESG